MRPAANSWTCGVSGHVHETEADALRCQRRRTVSAPYGWCPHAGCDARGFEVKDGVVRCEKGHLYPESEAT